MLTVCEIVSETDDVTVNEWVAVFVRVVVFVSDIDVVTVELLDNVPVCVCVIDCVCEIDRDMVSVGLWLSLGESDVLREADTVVDLELLTVGEMVRDTDGLLVNDKLRVAEAVKEGLDRVFVEEADDVLGPVTEAEMFVENVFVLDSLSEAVPDVESVRDPENEGEAEME